MHNPVICKQYPTLNYLKFTNLAIVVANKHAIWLRKVWLSNSNPGPGLIMPWHTTMWCGIEILAKSKGCVWYGKNILSWCHQLLCYQLPVYCTVMKCVAQRGVCLALFVQKSIHREVAWRGYFVSFLCYSVCVTGAVISLHRPFPLHALSVCIFPPGPCGRPRQE